MIHTDASTLRPGTPVLVQFKDDRWGVVRRPGKISTPDRRSGKLWEVTLDASLHGRYFVSQLTDNGLVLEVLSPIKDVVVTDVDGDTLTVSVPQNRDLYPDGTVAVISPEALWDGPAVPLYLDRDGVRTLVNALLATIDDEDSEEERAAALAGDPPRPLNFASGCCGGGCN